MKTYIQNFAIIGINEKHSNPLINKFNREYLFILCMRENVVEKRNECK